MILVIIYLAICVILFLVSYFAFLKQDFELGPDHKFGYSVYNVKEKHFVFKGFAWLIIGAVSIPIINLIVGCWWFFAVTLRDIRRG